MRQLLAQSAKEVTVLAPLPGTTVGGCVAPATACKATFDSYIPGLFNLAIGLAAVIAVAWIIWGGIEYITTDSWSGKEDGRKRIWNAVLGLIIVVCAWFILFTINPNLLKLDLTLTSSNVSSPTFNLPPAQLPSGNCTDCQAIPPGIAIGNTGSNISQQIASNLTNLNTDLKAANINMTVTEANPPSGQHVDACHGNGTCIDATIPGLASISASEAANIQTFYNTATRSGFSSVVFEVRTQQEVNAWRALGVTASLNTSATGPHFHVKK